MGQCPNLKVSVSVKFPLFLSCVFGLLVLTNGEDQPQHGMKCSGYCTKDSLKCQLRGGKIIGFCTKNLMCCDPVVSASGTCGDKKSDHKTVFFRSPSFPAYAGGDLLCDFKIRIQNDTSAIRIDFLQVEMDGLPFLSGEANVAMCESDMLFIRGFNTWSPPARCGNLTGYGALIDINTRQTRNIGMLSIIAIMSSSKYRFNIRIAQIMKQPKRDLETTKDSIVKRSVYPPQPQPLPYIPPFGITPTKILIKTVHPEQLSSLAYYDSSIFAHNHREAFRLFDSLYPSDDSDWKSPSIVNVNSIVNGEDTVISTVPWQVSLRVKPEAFQSPLTDFQSFGSSTDTSLESSFDTTSSLSATEDVTMESNLYSNCTESEGRHFCGGSILDHIHIIVAAHCFFGSSKVDGMMNISSIMVVVGDTNKCTGDDEESGIFPAQNGIPKSFRYDVESILFHYGYDHSLLINDIAILRLNESIKYFKHIKPVKLARAGDNFEGSDVLLSGWGDRFTEGNTNNYSSEEPLGPSILQSTRLLQIQNRSFCNERDITQFGGASKLHILSHPKYLNVFDATLCTLTKNGSKVEVNTGRGDSGGPLISYYKPGNEKNRDKRKSNESEPILVGIVSYSIPFDEESGEMPDGVNKTVDFYTSVAFFREWIDLALASFEQIVKNVVA